MMGYIIRARAALDGAQLLLKAGNLAGAASRAYFAFFHAAQAAVGHAVGIDPKTIQTHQGLRRMFDLHVVKPGLVQAGVAASFGSIASTRVVADYGDEPLQRKEVEAAVERAKEFIEACERLIAKAPP